MEVGNLATQCSPCVSFLDRFRDRPHAKLIAVEASLGVGGVRIEQILRRLVEQSEMRAPWQIACRWVAMASGR
jgi:hypothetical protein